MKERIKKMRKALKLTQQEFANRIGISRNNVATYEVGKSNPGEAVVSLICREFNVNENWLRTGEGEMFIKRDREDEIAAAVHQLLSGESAEFKKRLISVLVSLKEEHWEILEDKVKELAAAHQEDTKSPAPQPADTASYTDDELAIYEKVKAIKEREADPERTALHAELDAALDEKEGASAASGSNGSTRNLA